MDLKQRKRVINRYDDGKSSYIDINGQQHPKYLTNPVHWGPGGFYTENSNLDWYNKSMNIGGSSGGTSNGTIQFNNPYEQSVAYGINPDKAYGSTSSQDHDGNYGYWGNVITSGINFAGQMVNDFNSSGVKRENEILGDAGTSYAYANGVAYQQQNNVNQLQQIREINAVNEGNAVKSAASGAAFGAAVGNIVPGLGTAAGAVIGGAIGAIGSAFGAKSKKAKLRKRIYNAQQLANRTNTFNRASAFTKGLQQDYYQQNADESGGILYANKGKDLKKPKL